ASTRARKRYEAIVNGTKPAWKCDPQKRRPIEGDCPICYEPLDEKQRYKIVWCKSGCGNNIHKECFVKWGKSKGYYRKITCVYCRVEWKVDADGEMSDEGYLNLARAQGMTYARGALMNS
ncbi:4636_t:CDS:2, partial [Acaulospora morrowiae]